MTWPRKWKGHIPVLIGNAMNDQGDLHTKHGAFNGGGEMSPGEILLQAVQAPRNPDFVPWWHSRKIIDHLFRNGGHCC